MRIRGKIIWALAVTANLGTFAAQRSRGGALEDPTQAVFLRDFAGVPAGVLSGAKAEVARIFSMAHVGIEWLDCFSTLDEAREPNPCPGRPGTIVLRVVLDPSGFIDKRALGYSILSEQGSFYATVSYTRVQQLMANLESAASLKQVLGHAMAHELGHILLGHGSHSETGLMQGNWDASQLNDASMGRLNFSRDQAWRIRDAVARRARDGALGGQAHADD